MNTTEIITDNGYYSEDNISALLQAGFDFITLAKTSIRWIRTEIDKKMEELNDFKGGMTENYVNTQLVMNGFTTYYWESDRGAEVDFVIQKDSKIFSKRIPPREVILIFSLRN